MIPSSNSLSTSSYIILCTIGDTMRYLSLIGASTYINGMGDEVGRTQWALEFRWVLYS